MTNKHEFIKSTIDRTRCRVFVTTDDVVHICGRLETDSIHNDCVRCKRDKAVSYGHGLCAFCYWNFKPIPKTAPRTNSNREVQTRKDGLDQ